MTPIPTVVTDRCAWGWAGCTEMYTGGHLCCRTERHKGACRCGCCGATVKVSLRRRQEVPP